ncbi:endonuclease/exonuclease/phosphatase family protein [Mycolicibacter sinensis]|uniref:endonuclease/exonuclease/phosphatase family protein n=1 Tax=Mycolicibacter sinensis (strain JDM601) TaxID=875328 RepID=UPI001041E8D3|nr:endonuclease/exonuclease/phosphatase family protein [Mycolicibacter sinensis]
MTGNARVVRLVEWNVAMALHAKAHLVKTLAPDIAVLPESAHPDRVGDALAAVGVTSMQWIGASPNKGLLVAAFGDWTLRIDDSYDPGYQWVMPLHVEGPVHLRMLAVWDMNHRGRGHDSARKLGACRASMQHYAEFLSGPADLTVISGDFNNSVYWDKPGGTVRFGDFMDQLQSRGLVSAYHHQHSCVPGTEAHPTLWWTRNIDKPYHVDYTFVCPAEAIDEVTTGTHTEWLAYSDHPPMTVDLRVTPRGTARAAVEATTVRSPVEPPEPTPPQQETRMTGTHQGHFDLAAGELDDMICGNDGKPLTQAFRPSYFTATWSGGHLAEVRIWGPRVLQDGSTGVRMLDHCWRKPPIDINALPSAVARRLRDYSAKRR